MTFYAGDHRPAKDAPRTAGFACTAPRCHHGRVYGRGPLVMPVSRKGQPWRYEATCRTHASDGLWLRLLLRRLFALHRR